MPFVRMKGLPGKVYVPDAGGEPRKQGCPDCYQCQQCSDDRCQICGDAGSVRRPEIRCRPATIKKSAQPAKTVD